MLSQRGSITTTRVQQEVEASDPLKKEGERTVPFAAADRLFRGPRCGCCNVDRSVVLCWQSEQLPPTIEGGKGGYMAA